MLYPSFLSSCWMLTESAWACQVNHSESTQHCDGSWCAFSSTLTWWLHLTWTRTRTLLRLNMALVQLILWSWLRDCVQDLPAHQCMKSSMTKRTTQSFALPSSCCRKISGRNLNASLHQKWACHFTCIRRTGLCGLQLSKQTRAPPLLFPCRSSWKCFKLWFRKFWNRHGLLSQQIVLIISSAVVISLRRLMMFGNHQLPWMSLFPCAWSTWSTCFPKRCLLQKPAISTSKPMQSQKLRSRSSLRLTCRILAFKCYQCLTCWALLEMHGQKYGQRHCRRSVPLRMLLALLLTPCSLTSKRFRTNGVHPKTPRSLMVVMIIRPDTLQKVMMKMLKTGRRMKARSTKTSNRKMNLMPSLTPATDLSVWAGWCCSAAQAAVTFLIAARKPWNLA